MKEYSYTSTPPLGLLACYRVNFTFTFVGCLYIMGLMNARKMEHIKIHSFPHVLMKLDLWWEINSQSGYGAGDSLLPQLSVLVWHSSETFLNQAIRAV